MNKTQDDQDHDPALTSAERQRRMRARCGPPVKFHVDPGTRSALEQLARSQRRSMGDLVRSALSMYLRDRYEHAPTLNAIDL